MPQQLPFLQLSHSFTFAATMLVQPWVLLWSQYLAAMEMVSWEGGVSRLLETPLVLGLLFSLWFVILLLGMGNLVDLVVVVVCLGYCKTGAVVVGVEVLLALRCWSLGGGEAFIPAMLRLYEWVSTEDLLWQTYLGTFIHYKVQKGIMLAMLAAI